MRDLVISEEEGSIVVRALYTVALADGALDERERFYLQMHRDFLGRVAREALDLDRLEPIDPADVGAALIGKGQREALVQRLVIMTMLDEEVQPAEIATLRRFCAELGVDEPGIAQLESFTKNRMKRLTFDLLRHGFIGTQAKRVWNERGLRGIFAAASAMGGGTNEALASRYRAFEQLEAGTLGRSYFDHLQQNQYALPGEKGGAPEMLQFHDLGHVLSGYPTDPHGEVEMAGYEAGYMNEDGFSVVLLALFVFHLGAPLPNTQPARGQFDLSAFRAAYDRGKALKLDLRSWDPSGAWARPLRDVQAELGAACSD